MNYGYLVFLVFEENALLHRIKNIGTFCKI